ncbi:MAG: hypothetical protein OCD01_08030 [Fibrobacterales bacterium]
MTLETGLSILLWAITLSSIPNILNSRSTLTTTINATVAALLFIGAVIMTTSIPGNTQAPTLALEAENHLNETRTPSVGQYEPNSNELTEEDIADLEREAAIEAPQLQEESAPPVVIAQAKKEKELKKAAKKKEKRRKRKEKVKTSKATIYSFLKSSKKLVKAGRKYVTALNKLKLSNIEGMSDSEYDKLITKTTKLSTQIKQYYRDVNRLKAPNPHGKSFKKTLIKAAADLRKSAKKMHAFVHDDNIEDYEKLYKSHVKYAKRAESRISELNNRL